VLSTTLAGVSIVLRPATLDIERYRLTYAMDVVAMVLAVAAAVLAIVVVRRITARLDTRASHAGGAEQLVAPAPEPPFVALEGRARPAILALALAAAIAAARIPAALIGQAAVGEARGGGPGADDALTRAETITDVLGGIWFAGLVLAAVLFLRWLHRAFRNLHAPGMPLARYTPGWAVGSWFVPFVNLVVPKKATNDAWRAGDPYAEVPGFVHLWWAGWIVASFLGNIASRPLWSPRKGLDEEHGYYTVDLIGAAVEVAAALLAIAVVRSVTQASRRAVAARATWDS
jgi:hypothetical protein